MNTKRTLGKVGLGPFVLAAVVLLVFTVTYSANASVKYSVGSDDYFQMYIDGTLVASYDDYPSGGDQTDLLNLTGWHDIQIDYKNRYGSNYLSLYSISEAGESALVPLEHLRCQNAAGAFISGLKAEYFSLSGTPIKTIFGEGPIEHGARFSGSTLLTYYQSVWPSPWAGIFDGWSLFEERLSGQILISTNNPPVAVNDNATTHVGVPIDVAVLTNDSDTDGDALTVTEVTQGAHGAVNINPDGTVHYAPSPAFSGTDTFTYIISDGNEGFATATVNVIVLDDQLIARDDKATTLVGVPVDVTVLANDYNPDGDKLFVAEVTQGVHGAVSINPNGTVRYTPAPGYTGTDTFTYTVSESEPDNPPPPPFSPGTIKSSAGSNIGTVEITVVENCLVLTTLNGGETFNVGTAQFITWTYGCNIGPYVKVELLDASGKVLSVISPHALAGTGGVGGIQWIVPSNLPIPEVIPGSLDAALPTVLPQANYMIRVSSVLNPAITDTSDGAFTVVGEALFSWALTSPNGPGTEWVRGVKQTITWEYTGNPHSSVRIDLLRNGAYVRNIAQNVSIGVGGLGQFDWTPTSLAPGNGYKIRITLTKKPLIIDESESPFKVL